MGGKHGDFTTCKVNSFEGKVLQLFGSLNLNMEHTTSDRCILTNMQCDSRHLYAFDKQWIANCKKEKRYEHKPARRRSDGYQLDTSDRPHGSKQDDRKPNDS